ncbi:MAG TPA: hypothetical protein VFF73_28640 [Planctomycetota bacterium]|nr:hypothetical protein [Planctomycetota bacterium]
MFEYPRVIEPPFGPFDPVDLAIKSERAKAASDKRHETHVSFHSGSHSPMQLAEKSDLVGVTRCILVLGEKTSTSYNNGDQNQKKYLAAGHDGPPFWFCPGVDTEVKLGWKTRHEEAIEKVTVEVWAAGIGKVSSKELEVSKLKENPIPEKKCVGTMKFSDLLDLSTSKAPFPDGVLTAEYSPYQVRFIVEKKSTSTAELYPSVAWTFFHVLVARELDLDWGEESQIPDGVSKGAHVDWWKDTEKDEKDLFKELKNEHINFSQRIELRCVALSGGAGPNDPKKLSENGDALRATWGDGPRIPLKVVARVLKADGMAAPDGDSAKALGAVKFLWDWSEGPGRTVDAWFPAATPTRPGLNDLSRKYVKGCAEIIEANQQPLGSLNCPKTYGGKRGDYDRPIFPAQDKTGKLGFEVKQLPETAARSWASESLPGEGDKGATSGVIFQPSPYPGDRYKVYVYLTGRGGGTDLPQLSNVADGLKSLHDGIASLSPSERPPLAATGLYTVYRKAKVNYIVQGCRLDPATVNNAEEIYEKQFFTLVEHTETPFPPDGVVKNNRWKNIYDQAVADKVGLNGLVIANALKENQPNPVGDCLLDIKPYKEWLKTALALNLISVVVYRSSLVRIGDMIQTKEGSKAVVVSWEDFVPGTKDERNQVKKIVDLADKEGRKVLRLNALVLSGGLMKNGDTFTDGGKDLHKAFSVRNCSFMEVRWDDAPPDNDQPANVIKVTLKSSNAPKKEVQVKYDKGIFGKEYPAAVSSSGRNALKKAYEQAFAAYVATDTTKPWVIEIKSKFTDEPRCHERLNDLRDYLEELNAGLLLKNDVLATSQINEDWYNDKIWGFAKSKVLDIAKAVYKDDLPGVKDGLVYFYLDRAWQNPNSVTGGIMPSEGSPRRGLGYQQSVFGGTRARQRFYSQPDLLAHELGHAFFRGAHAPTRLWTYQEMKDDKGCVPNDGCIMNYDPDPTQMHFCGRCLLRFRGWSNLPWVNDFPLAEASLKKEAEDETNLEWKAWRYFRVAKLYQDDKRKCADYLEKALDAWTKTGNGWSSPDAINVLRVATAAYRGLGTEVANLKAREYFAKLCSATSSKLDIAIGDASIGGTISNLKAAYILDGSSVAYCEEGNFQFVNLPVNEKLVDGDHVTSRDRLGKDVRVKLAFTQAGRYHVKLELRAHKDNSAYDQGNVASQPVAIVRSDFTHIDDTYETDVEVGTDGSVVVDHVFRLETDAGGDRFLIEATDDKGSVVQSVVLTTARAFFWQRVVCKGPAQQYAVQADKYDEFQAKLDEAFWPHFVYMIHVGNEELDGYKYVLDEKGTDLQNAVFALGSKPTTYGGGGRTYADLRPYLLQIVFVDQVVRSGVAMQVFDNVDLTQTGELTAEELKTYYNSIGPIGPAIRFKTCIWEKYPDDKRYPDDLPTLLAGMPDFARDYRGKNAPGKEWFFKGEITILASDKGDELNQVFPLEPGDLTPVEDDSANQPKKASKVKIDLGRFKGAHGQAKRAKVSLHVLGALPVGGLNVSGGKKSIVFATTRKSYTDAARPLDDQIKISVHETAHSLNMANPDGDYFYDKGGFHCHEGIDAKDDVRLYINDRDKATCVMFEAVANARVFCESCGAYLRNKDVSGRLV